jgi:glycosyltransferase involved in cell wall biosynthesis
MNGRDATVCMMRIRNEARWMPRSLARSFRVCRAVVVWDDGSTDDTETRVQSFFDETVGGAVRAHGMRWGWLWSGLHRDGLGHMELHYLRSPFRPARREIQNVDEVRDKNALWEYVKAQVEFRTVLCMDGDEMLSQAIIREWPALLTALERGLDMLAVPIIQLWDSEEQRRIDGWYGDSSDGRPRVRHPRVLTVAHLNDEEIYHLHFAHAGSRGNFHCGFLPRAGVHRDWRLGVTAGTIVHFGYLHARDRQRKYEWYNRIDPDNEFEGRYAHVVGLPDQHAPGPVQLAPWEDR